MAKTSLIYSLRRLLKVEKSRRQFLKDAAQIGVLATCGPHLLSCASEFALPQKETASNSDRPVIIIGGGIAGLTAAFYLTRAKIPCEIHEASSRLGGRMFTKKDFNSQGMSCELGGELVDSNHTELIQLCHFFNIAVDDFAPGDAGLEKNLYHFNTVYTDRDAIKALKKFNRWYRKDYELAQTTKGRKKFDDMTLSDYLDHYRHRVDDWFLNLLRVAYVGENGLEADQLSALGLVSSLDPDTHSGFKIYGDSDEAKKIRGGNQALIEALEKWLLTYQVPIYKNSQLIALEDSSQRLILTFNTEGSKNTRRALRAICTIPFTVLRRVDGIFDTNMSPLKKSCIREMSYGTNGKQMLGFTERLWRKGIEKVPPSNGMVYTDLFVQNIWETSRTQIAQNQTSPHGILTVFLGGRDGARLSPADRMKSLSAIDAIFPGTQKLFDSNEATFNWTQNKYSLGSYSTMVPGQLTRFGKVGSHTELDGKLLFAGEHVAPQFGGFMNGACLSGRIAAQKLI